MTRKVQNLPAEGGIRRGRDHPTAAAPGPVIRCIKVNVMEFSARARAAPERSDRHRQPFSPPPPPRQPGSVRDDRGEAGGGRGDFRRRASWRNEASGPRSAWGLIWVRQNRTLLTAARGLLHESHGFRVRRFEARSFGRRASSPQDRLSQDPKTAPRPKLTTRRRRLSALGPGGLKPQ